VNAPWNKVLDEIEADLAAVETALAERSPAPVRPRPGAGSEPLGPMPEELAPRAQFLLERTRSLEAQAETDRDRIGASLRALRGRQMPETARTGRVVDMAG
jgi:hypothetical protein